MDNYSRKTNTSSNDDDYSAVDIDLIGEGEQEDYREELEEMQQCIKDDQEMNHENINRFRDFQRIVFKSAMTNTDSTTLASLGRPEIEFNILNPEIDRLCGEFSKQEPSIYVSANEGSPIDPRLLEAIQGHLNHTLFEAAKSNTQYETYRDQLTGGFCSYKVYADYCSEMSFEQDIKLCKVYDATLVGYDPVSRQPTGSDADWAYELFPMKLETFQKQYPAIDTSTMDFKTVASQSNFSFSFTYKVGNQKIIILADFYKKKKVPAVIIKLSNGQVIEKDDYKELKKKWQSIEQIPVITAERETILTKVCRYRFTGNKMIEYEKECLSNLLPLVRADGNSVWLHDGAEFKMFNKPYMYHAWGLQRLVNLAGQTIATDIENISMQKLIIAEEALPAQQDYKDMLIDFQKSDLAIHRAFMDDGTPLPQPREIQRNGLPQEVIHVFDNGAQMLQNITGSYDAQIGVDQKDLSGKAIVEGATQSNATAMPYVVNNVLALNQVANVSVSMYPKIYVTPRSIPVRLKDGTKTFIRINDENDPNSVSFDYDPSQINVKVEAGVNFEIEKNRALEQLFGMMKASPKFAQFIGDNPKVILQNMNFHGVDVLIEQFEAWEQQQQQNPQPNPDLINAQANQMKAQADMMDAQANQAKMQAEIQQGGYETMIKAKQAEVAEEEAQTNRIKALTAAGQSRADLAIQISKTNAEDMRTKAEMGLAVAQAVTESNRADTEQEHSHLKDILEMSHNMSMDKQKLELDNKKADNDKAKLDKASQVE